MGYCMHKRVKNIVATIGYIIIFINMTISAHINKSSNPKIEGNSIANNVQKLKESTIFLWDIHGVIVERKVLNTLVAVLTYKKKWHLFTKLFNKKLQKALFEKNIGSSERIIEVAKEHNNKELAQLVRKLANLQTPIKGTTAIISELHNAGYMHHIGSNIGEEIFDELQKKLPHVFNNTFFDIARSQVASYAKDNELSKPNPAFFHAYLRKNNIDLGKTTIIFIDDKKKTLLRLGRLA